MNGFFFFRKKNDSGREAGTRLRQVIDSDRICAANNKSVEKIRKEIIEILQKYSNDETVSDGVCIAAVSGGECILKVRVPLKIK